MHYKTSLEIERDFYHLVKKFFDGKITGKVYPFGTRPTGKSEDIVVSHLAGQDGQVQRGVVVVSVYVPNLIANSSFTIRNVNRCTELSRLLMDLVLSYTPNQYHIKTDRAIECEAEGGDMHRLTLRIKYKYNTYQNQ